MKKKIKRSSVKAVEQSLFDPFKNLSAEKVVPLKSFRKRLESKKWRPSKGIMSEEEFDLLDRRVDRPNESRAWLRQRFGLTV